MLSGVLFDLDGTLLDIELDPFLHDYFAALSPVVATILDDESTGRAGIDAVLRATQAMMQPHPGHTNRQVFNDHFAETTGVDLGLTSHSEVLDRFYAEVFPTLKGTISPRPGGKQAVETALALGLKVAIATNPIFPRSAVIERMRWAGLDDLDIPVITSYENMSATKPHAAYFLETTELMGVDPTQCLMVGDDSRLDMPAADTGMRTFYVGPHPIPRTTWSGTLEQLAEILPGLTDNHA